MSIDDGPMFSAQWMEFGSPTPENHSGIWAAVKNWTAKMC